MGLMQANEIIWEIINRGKCSYRLSTKNLRFCKNKYNNLGLCSAKFCPIYSTNYASVILEVSDICLLIKNQNKSHNPEGLWTKIKISNDYVKGLNQLDVLLNRYSTFLLHRIKQ